MSVGIKQIRSWKRGRRRSSEKVLQYVRVRRANAAENMVQKLISRCGEADFFVGVAEAEAVLSAAAVPDESAV